MRQCRLLDYDRDKYCDILVGGTVQSVKRGYVYRKPYGYSPDDDSISMSSEPVTVRLKKLIERRQKKAFLKSQVYLHSPCVSEKSALRIARRARALRSRLQRVADATER